VVLKNPRYDRTTLWTLRAIMKIVWRNIADVATWDELHAITKDLLQSGKRELWHPEWEKNDPWVKEWVFMTVKVQEGILRMFPNIIPKALIADFGRYFTEFLFFGWKPEGKGLENGIEI